MLHAGENSIVIVGGANQAEWVMTDQIKQARSPPPFVNERKEDHSKTSAMYFSAPSAGMCCTQSHGNYDLFRHLLSLMCGSCCHVEHPSSGHVASPT